MRIFLYSISAIVAILFAVLIGACQRIDVDEHEYDTVTPYLPDIPPDPEVVTVPPEKPAEQKADGDSERESAALPDSAALTGPDNDRIRKVLEEVDKLNLHIIQDYQQKKSADTQK